MPPSPRVLSVWKRLVFACVPVLVTIALVELLFRGLVQPQREDPALRWRFLQRFHPFLGIYRRPAGKRTLKGEYGTRTFTTNHLGFRGEEIDERKPDGAFRIACMGGSTTENEFVDDSETYCALLQHMLRDAARNPKVEVINAACATYSTAHSFISYSLRVCELQPDLITIYHGINDLVPGMCPGFEPDYSHFYRFYHMVGAVQTDLRLAMRTPLDGLLGWSAIYRFTKARVAERVRSRIAEPASFRVAPACRVTGAGPAVFERNLRAIIRLAKGDGTNVLLCTFPYSLRENMSPQDRQRLGGFGWYKFLTVEGVIDGLLRHNLIVRRLAKEEGCLLCDLEAVVPKDFDHFFDACHIRPKGQKLAAQALCKSILAAKLIPARADMHENSRPKR